MSAFELRNGELHAEGVSLARIAADAGTPAYVYSRAAIERQFRAFDSAFGARDHLVCYAVKANSNLGLLNVLARLGSGFDIVSRGELERVLRAGGDARKVVFSGVGKTDDEIEFALRADILCFNIESEAELHAINRIAGALKRRAAISLRINPDVDAGTHPYISTGLKENKFGIDIADAARIYADAARLPHVRVTGLDCHIGSQLTELAPFRDALDRMLGLLDALTRGGIAVEHFDVGGGLGIDYKGEKPPTPEQYVATILQRVGTRRVKLMIEPGRAIVGNAGVLLTRVIHLKHSAHKNFAIVDAAMNDLIRPSLYGAWQHIVPVAPRAERAVKSYDVVGPVCETGDFLGKQRDLNIEPGDLLAVMSAGAYGFVMSSNYNTRARAAEVMVDGDTYTVVRERERITDLYAMEHLLPR